MRSKFYTELEVDQITQILYLAETGWSAAEIARELKISKPAIANIINEAMGGDDE